MATSMTSARGRYHHGDLRSACLTAARELLEEEADLSLRAVARRAGVSPAALYRHYADKGDLISALSALGCRELGSTLAEASAEPSTPDDFADMAVAYVRFAIERPALFRVMFSTPCAPGASQHAMAAAEVDCFVRRAAVRACPAADPEAVGIAAWALLHGLAFLYLEEKLPTESVEVVDASVRTAIGALIGSRVR